MTERLLCNKREAASALGISVRTLENLLSMKQLKSVRIGRRRLVPVQELSRFCGRDHVTQAPGSTRTEGVAREGVSPGGSR
jgi:excisionase family DNA binding protein